MGIVRYTILLHESPRLRDAIEKMAAEVEEYVQAGWSDEYPLQVHHVGSTWSVMKEMAKYEDPGAELGAEV